MQTVSYTDARNKLASLMDTATKNREPLMITRNGEGTVILLAAEEFSAMEETLYLLSTPANAERIRRGLKDYKARKLKPGKLCD